MHDVCRKGRRILALMLIVGSSAAAAQSCQAPLSLASGAAVGNSCVANHLPALNLGSTYTTGPQVVYSIGRLPASSVLSLAPASGVDLALFVCHAPCGGASQCVAASDSAGLGGVETVSITEDIQNAYVFVTSTSSYPQTCGGYTLNVWVAGD